MFGADGYCARSRKERRFYDCFTSGNGLRRDAPYLVLTKLHYRTRWLAAERILFTGYDTAENAVNLPNQRQHSQFVPRHSESRRVLRASLVL